jgi:thiol:disulfide interchange protein DsbD
MGSASPAAAQPEGMTENVSVRAVPQFASVKAGGSLIVAIEMTHQAGWHSWPVAGTKMPAGVDDVLSTELTARDPVPAWVKLDGVQWPTPHDEKVANPSGGPSITAPTYSGVAVLFARVAIAPTAPAGPAIIPLNLFYQSCNETICAFPTDVALDVSVTILPAGSAETPAPTEAGLFTAFDAGKLAGPPAPGPGTSGASGGAAPASGAGDKPGALKINDVGVNWTIDAGSLSGLAIIIGLAVLGGFLLNLMPCVLPVIPIKILSLSKSAGNPKRCFFLGCVASAGVIAAWLAVGLIAAGLGVATNQLYTHWWFNVGIGLLIGVMGLGMLGLFVVNLPQSVYMVNPTTDSAGGSFIFGVFTVILALPCVAPFAGAVSGWALAQPTHIVLAVFLGIGVGMALPYLVLSAKPSWINRIPRTGPASELVKQVMAGFMVAIAIYFLGSGLAGVTDAYPKKLHWYLIAGISLFTGLWLIVKAFGITRSPGKRLGATLAAVIFAGAPIYMAVQLINLVEWPAYSREAFDQARARGDVVVVDFTAEWCLNCKTLKSTVLSKKPVEAATTRPGVTRLIADLTRTSAPGHQLVREVGANGIPLLLIYKPGEPKPVFRANAYTVGQVVQAVDDALAAKTASAAPVRAPEPAAAPSR